MAMKVNFNLSAILANDYLRKSDEALTASTQRLSSGFKLNRAGDSPSGIAIGRRMRAQIRGLNQAGLNATDAVSVVQTAEGALNEIHDMLQRLNELCIKSANGPMAGDGSLEDRQKAEAGMTSTTTRYDAGTDRAMIQDEVDQLLAEINRVAATTEFNSRKLLNGSFDLKGYTEKVTACNTDAANTDLKDKLDAKMPDGALEAITVEAYSDETREGVYAVSLAFGEKYEYSYKDNYDDAGTYQNTTVSKTFKGMCIADMKIVDVSSGAEVTINNLEHTLIPVFGATDAYLDEDMRTATIKGEGGFSITIDVDFSKLTKKLSENDPDYNEATGGLIFTDESEITDIVDPDSPEFRFSQLSDGTDRKYVDKDGNPVLDKDGNPITNPASAQEAKEKRDEAIAAASLTTFINITGKGAMTELIGAEAGTVIDIRIPNINCKNLGIQDLDVLSEDAATASIDRVSRAIDRLSSIRSRLGAYQNRLEHTVNSLNASEESITEAFSRIMDTDMAKEMTEYSQKQVLTQAGTSILAQANQRPSQMLQLLQ